MRRVGIATVYRMVPTLGETGLMRNLDPDGRVRKVRVGRAAVLSLVAMVATAAVFPSAVLAAAPVTRPLTIAVIATGPATPPTDELIAQMVEVARTTWLSYLSGALTFVLGSIVRVERPGMPCRIPVVNEVGWAIGFQPKRDGHLIGLMVGEGCWVGGQATHHGRHVWVDWMQGIESAGTTLAHELGHNLGLIHTTTENCGSLLDPLCSSSAAKKAGVDEYGGDDLMGSGSRFLNPVMLRALGYLTPDATTVLRAGAAGPFRAELAPNSTSGGARALRVVQGRDEWFLSYDATDAPPVLRVHASRRRGAAVQQRYVPLTGWYGIPAGSSVRLGKGFLTVVSLDGVATVEVDGRTGPAVTVDASVPRTAAVSVPAASLAAHGPWRIEVQWVADGVLQRSVQDVSSASPVAIFGLPSGVTYRALLLRDDGAGFAPVSVSAAFATAPDTSTAPAISVVPADGGVTVSWTGGAAEVLQIRYCWTLGNEVRSYWTTPWMATSETIPMDGPNGTIWMDLRSHSGDRCTLAVHRRGKGCQG
jgi:hypothetical protein